MFKFYGKFWLATKYQLNDLRLRETAKAKLNDTSDRGEAHRIFASLYVRYVRICNNLSELYDQTLQVQKRRVIMKLLEAATTRLLELEKELKNVELSEFFYLDDEVKEMHFVPNDVKLLRPLYFPRDRREDMKQLLREKQEETERENEDQKITDRNNAIIMIQSHELARQTRRNKEILTEKMEKAKSGKGPSALYGGVVYNFYHKPDQLPLIPIKRSTFTPDFCQDIVAMSEYSFYKPSNRETQLESLKKEIMKVATVEFEFLPDPTVVSAMHDEDEDEVKPPKAYLMEKCDTRPVNVDDNYIKIQVVLKERSDEVFEDAHALKKAELLKKLAKLNAAAWVIQRNWLIYRLRKLIEQRRYRKLVYLGMIEGEAWDRDIYRLLEENTQKRSAKKPMFDDELVKAALDERARIVRVKSPYILEDISDHIRAWFRAFYDHAGDFDKYPPELKGGTVLVLYGKTMTPEEFLIEKKKTPEQKKKEKEKKAKDKAKEKEKRKQEKKKLRSEIKKRAVDRKKREEKEGQIWQFRYPENISKKFVQLDKTMEEYERDWYGINEMANIDEKPIMEWITADEMQTLHFELRKVVDVYMRTEHELLMIALAKDNKKKYKPPKQPKQKKPKNKKKKKTKPQPPEERSGQSIFEEFLQTNIIRNFPRRSLTDFYGDRNYLAQEERLKDGDPPHYAEDVVNMIMNSLLGMGNMDFPKARSMLFAGPPLTGKKFLVDAICTETDAVLFDISPENTEHISSNQAPAFLDLVMKMAKLLQPSIILMNNVHKVFYTKIPKDEINLPDPRTLGQYLFKKVIKKITKTDRVMLLGCTNNPPKGKRPPMKKCFEKVFLLPKMNYGCTFFSWWKTATERSYIPKDIELSPLALVTTGTTTGKIIKTFDKVMNVRRRMKLAFQPLKLEEFLEFMMAESPADIRMEDKEYLKHVGWFQKMNALALRRVKMIKKKEAAAAKKKK